MPPDSDGGLNAHQNPRRRRLESHFLSRPAAARRSGPASTRSPSLRRRRVSTGYAAGIGSCGAGICSALFRQTVSHGPQVVRKTVRDLCQLAPDQSPRDNGRPNPTHLAGRSSVAQAGAVARLLMGSGAGPDRDHSAAEQECRSGDCVRVQQDLLHDRRTRHAPGRLYESV
jgi:hypothetical protein